MINWIQNNQVLFGMIVTLLVTVISTVVSQTKTDTDNKVWDFIRSCAAQLGWLDKDGKFSFPLASGPLTDKFKGK